MIMGVILGTIIVTVRRSWPITWLGIELNLICFVPLVIKEEAIKKVSMLYYIVQSIGSLFMLGAGLLIDSSILIISIIIFRLITKLGAIPIHFWVPSVIISLNKIGSYIALSWQKIAPVSIISSIIISLLKISYLNIWIGAMLIIAMRAPLIIVIFSGIVQIGWIFTLHGHLLWWYVSIYFVILIPIILLIYKADKNFRLAIINRGGLPPFRGFCIKLTAVIILISKRASIIVIGRGVALISYTRIIIRTLYKKSRVSRFIVIPLTVGIV